MANFTFKTLAIYSLIAFKIGKITSITFTFCMSQSTSKIIFLKQSYLNFSKKLLKRNY